MLLKNVDLFFQCHIGCQKCRISRFLNIFELLDTLFDTEKINLCFWNIFLKLRIDQQFWYQYGPLPSIVPLKVKSVAKKGQLTKICLNFRFCAFLVPLDFLMTFLIGCKIFINWVNINRSSNNKSYIHYRKNSKNSKSISSMV